MLRRIMFSNKNGLYCCSVATKIYFRPGIETFTSISGETTIFFQTFFPNFFENLEDLENLENLENLEKFGKVWKILFPSFPISELETHTILMSLYRVLYFQHVSKSRDRGTFPQQRSHRANIRSISKKKSFLLFPKFFSKLFPKINCAKYAPFPLLCTCFAW